jgi:hypothetical protein
MNIECCKFNVPKWDPTHNFEIFERCPKKLACHSCLNNTTRNPPQRFYFILFYFLFYFILFYFTTQTYIYKHKDMQKFVMKCKTNEKWVAENGFKKMHPTLLTTPRKL